MFGSNYYCCVFVALSLCYSFYFQTLVSDDYVTLLYIFSSILIRPFSFSFIRIITFLSGGIFSYALIYSPFILFIYSSSSCTLVLLINVFHY